MTSSAELMNDLVIAAGLIAIQIGIPVGSSGDIDGVTYTGPATIVLPPLSHGNQDRLYPAIDIVVTDGPILVFAVFSQSIEAPITFRISTEDEAFQITTEDGDVITTE